jgi:hypothetical protein
LNRRFDLPRAEWHGANCSAARGSAASASGASFWACPPADAPRPAPQPPQAAAVASLPAAVRLDPNNVRNGLMQLVLTLVELLRELLERQAIRRIEGGSLTPDEIERLGLTFLRLSEEMTRLKRQFDLTDDDLNLDLGPLGTLR